MTYYYGGWFALAVIMYRVVGSLFALLGLVVGGFATYQAIAGPGDWSGILCIGGIWMLNAIIGGMFFVYFYPVVAIDDFGIRLSSWPYPDLRIAWTDVVAQYEGSGLKDRLLFVQTRRLSLLHHFYGFYFLYRWVPGFVVRKDAVGYEDLRKQIRRKLAMVPIRP